MTLIKLTNWNDDDAYVQHDIIETILGGNNEDTVLTLAGSSTTSVKEKAHIVASKIRAVTRDDLIIVQYLNEAQCEELGRKVVKHILSGIPSHPEALAKTSIDIIKDYVTALMRADSAEVNEEGLP